MPLEGRCTCGEVRYRLTRAPMFVHCCHCTDCQRETGSAFVINALVEAARVETLQGAPGLIPTPTNSGTPQLICRCPSCHVALWSHYGGRTAVCFVRAGTLERASAITPDVHIFVRSKLPWVRLPEGAPAYDIYYDTEALWPPEAFARRKAALGL
jgi:hypothetical protein